MREIKFRAWHTEAQEGCTGCIKSVIGIDFVNGITVLLDEDRGTQELWEWRHIELMQFTGLHDKNGKEIYEGDIITNTYSAKLVQIPPFEVKDIRLIYTYIYEGQFKDDVEIIGNIYENPELLKEEA